jgi:hypothetical protein
VGSGNPPPPTPKNGTPKGRPKGLLNGMPKFMIKPGQKMLRCPRL